MQLKPGPELCKGSHDAGIFDPVPEFVMDPVALALDSNRAEPARQKEGLEESTATCSRHEIERVQFDVFW